MCEEQKNGDVNDVSCKEQSEVNAKNSLQNSLHDKPTSGSGDGPVDENDDDSRKLFVGGLSWETTEDELRDYFSQWGKVTQCIIKLDRFTGNSRGFGFVTLESEECVAKVLGVPVHKLKNKRIDPKKAKPSREPFKKIFVGGIDPDVTEEQIKEYFGAFGKIESLDLPFDNNKGKRKHYIFVSFTTEAAAKKAIAEERQEIFGRQCDVRVAVTREQASRQKAFRQWCNNWFEPTFAYQSYAAYGTPYPFFDPLSYNFYGYDYYGNAAVAAASNYNAAYSNLNSTGFRVPPNATSKGGVQQNSNNRVCNNSSASRPLTGLASGTPSSLLNHFPVHQVTQSHGATNNLSNVSDQQFDLAFHLPPGVEFSGQNQHSAGIVAGAACGYPQS